MIFIFMIMSVAKLNSSAELFKRRIYEKLSIFNNKACLINPHQLRFELQVQNKKLNMLDLFLEVIKSENKLEVINKIDKINNLRELDDIISFSANSLLDKCLHVDDEFNISSSLEAFSKYIYSNIESKAILFNYNMHHLEFNIGFAYKNYGELTNQSVSPNSNIDYLAKIIKIAFSNPDVNIFITPLVVLINQDYYANMRHCITFVADRNKSWIIDSTPRFYPVLVKSVASKINMDHESITTHQQGNNKLCMFFSMFYIKEIILRSSTHTIKQSIDLAIKYLYSYGKSGEAANSHVDIENIMKNKKNDLIKTIRNISSIMENK